MDQGLWWYPGSCSQYTDLHQRRLGSGMRHSRSLVKAFCHDGHHLPYTYWLGQTLVWSSDRSASSSTCPRDNFSVYSPMSTHTHHGKKLSLLDCTSLFYFSSSTVVILHVPLAAAFTYAFDRHAYPKRLTIQSTKSVHVFNGNQTVEYGTSNAKVMGALALLTYCSTMRYCWVILRIYSSEWKDLPEPMLVSAGLVLV